MATTTDTTTAEQLIDWVCDARQRSIELTDDLSGEQLIGPQLPTLNPLVWEIGHAAWFQEKWILRHLAGQAPGRPDVDDLYDSIAIAHETRWDLPLLSRADTYAYIREVRDRIVDVLSGSKLTDDLVYFVKLGVFHEDMHAEAFAYARQTLGYPRPKIAIAEPLPDSSDRVMADEKMPIAGDVEISGGTWMLGAPPDEPFVFDNEKWAHPVEVRPFAIARTAVTQSQFAEFVEDDGYRRAELWCEAGRKWQAAERAEQPIYWQRDAAGHWLRRDFDRWVVLEPDHPILHVNWYEASAYCRWAGRRLPREAEWEWAAASPQKRRFPWGKNPTTPERANLDWRKMGTVDVGACAAGDSPTGCRQMIGNVWEWTDTTFEPYPEFSPDPYKEYSQPCFGSRKVLRGGAWVTRSRLVRNTWRNYHCPDRRDVWAGFRTCAVD